ncbi:HAMP domain-containing protein [Pigmentiphaga aceris]|uniref:histidine kinase n=1 Tax=Pigmentiphaga aceris TaxID=1940612 RepID=A0A5C0B407_9BURK|nr:ATP-binding protein [Pigmentiphaga aceris]QEI07531.1 HAMP domain-containing protein [Pigmentiphaga aceris]
MTSQLCLVLALALFGSHLIAVLFLQSTGELIHPLSRQQVVDRLAVAYRALQTIPAEHATRVMQATATEQARLWVSPEADVAAAEMREEENRLADALRTRLSLSADTQVRIQLERADGDHARAPVLSPRGWAPLELRSSIALPDGQWLNSDERPSGSYEWSRLLAFSLPVSTLPALFIMLVFVRRIVAPIKTLAAATDRLSHGERLDPLPLAGPREARELTDAFNAMQLRLTRYVEGRTRMLAAISHDFRTPLTAMRLQAELIDDDALRHDMLESVAELQSMTEHTLDFVRDDAMHEATVTLPINRLIDEVVKRYRLMDEPVIWNGASDVACRCRPLSLKRAMTNLIDNALRHGGSAEIRLQVEHSSSSLRIDILDSGPGIPQALLEQVFEPFVQLGARGEDALGRGLGLAIARSAVQAHGGELTLENRSAGGLNAIIRLPGSLLQG